MCLRRLVQHTAGFPAVLRERDRVCKLAGLTVRYQSTKTAPQLPRMDYQDAIYTLNTLQTNASALEQVRKERSHPQAQLQAMRSYLERASLTDEALDHLNIIHVTGTKGKGSTCAFTERILRGYGFRTGFYSSPHLVQVRERIRINGQPIGKDLFTKYFWQVYRQLDETKDAHGGAMPAYFRFLTILAFHIFLKEKVDLAVVEVGIGGAYDCTNIIRRPWVCGISSLGIDHTQILGDTIEKIAWQKGGIFKPGVPAFTVKQPEDAMAVLRDRAKEIKCPLWVCPELERYQTEPLCLGLAGQHQRLNASLALQLSHAWLQKRCVPDKRFPTTNLENSSLPRATSFKLSPFMVKGLAETEWPGRNQTLKHGALTYFLDGAHTMRSMQACVQWFREAAAQHERNASGPVARVLLFNATGERDSAAMLKLLVPCRFDFAVFCPNITEAIDSCNADQQNFNVSVENMLTRCLDNESSWHLHTGRGGRPGTELHIARGLLPAPDRRADSLVFPCILSALQWIAQGRDSVLGDAAGNAPAAKPSAAARAGPLREAAHVHVLVTGSLHLVGGVLKHLDPESSK
ncbi:folylpolyglutamate synthase, mitochondrial-like [Menidia menidia]